MSAEYPHSESIARLNQYALETEPLGIRTKLGRAGAALLLAGGSSLVASVAEGAISPAPVYAAAEGSTAIVGMPFKAQWAFNVEVQPPYTDENSSHPSAHASYGFDWSTDIYPVDDDHTVRVWGSSANGEVKFKRNKISDTCSSHGDEIAGKGVVFDVLVDGSKVGEVKYDHLDLVDVGEDAINNGTKIGVVTDEDLHATCYQTSHVHVQFKNTEGNRSCYVDHGSTGKTLTAKTALGILGSSNTVTKQACAETPKPENIVKLTQDLAWWTGSILNTRPHDAFQISSATDGLAPPVWADVMDYDGDGLDDVILFREDGGYIKVIRKNPQGGWLPLSDAARGPNILVPYWAAVADLDNNDKENDLIWWSPNGISKLIGENLGTTSTTTGIAAPEWADVIDYNQDGRDDIVLLRPDGSLRVLLNSASGGWNAAVPNPVRTGVTQPAWAGVGDFNGDGKAREIAWWNASGNVSILNGANKFALTSTTEGITPPDWAEVMDYDGDGKDDIVFYRQSDGTLNILRKSPSGDGFYLLAANPIRGPGVSSPSWAGVGDFTK
jgi:hypothetical protein